MAKLVYGWMQSLDGYVDHMKLGPPCGRCCCEKRRLISSPSMWGGPLSGVGANATTQSKDLLFLTLYFKANHL